MICLACFTFLAVQVYNDREISICLVENVVTVLSRRLFNGIIISDGFLSNCKEYVLLKVFCFHIADSDEICYPEVPFQVELLIVPEL